MDEHQVLRVLQAQFPELCPASVAWLGEGEDHSAFEVNERLVFRFPKRADVEAQILRELRVLPVLARSQPAPPIPIPLSCIHGRPSPGFRYHFAGYLKLSGVPAIEVEPARIPFDAIAPKLADFLSWLHAFPTDDAASLGVEREEMAPLLEKWQAEALGKFALLNRVAPDAPLEAWHAYLKAGPPLLPSGSRPDASGASPPVLLHNDLGAEHILLDPSDPGTGTLTGIIDWSDMALGHRWVDFGGLFHWGGAALVEAVLSAYRGPVDRGLLPWARFYAACKGVTDVEFGVNGDQPEYVSAGLRALALSAGS